MLSLFPDENVVSRSSNGSVTLTSHRICYEYKAVGQSYNQSIMLEHITSCENYFNSSILALVIGCAALVFGFFAASGNQGQVAATLILLAVVSGVFYWLSRKNFIVIASPSTKMMIKTKGMSKDLVLSFINKVEHARLLNLNK